MKHKLMIYIPLVLFISATVVLAMGVISQKNENKIEIPAVLLKPTPTVVEIIPTPEPMVEVKPTPVDPSIQIKSDLNSIMQDIGKLKVEDTRFKPPSFVFEMGI
jgi:hypothetical protein